MDSGTKIAGTGARHHKCVKLHSVSGRTVPALLRVEVRYLEAGRDRVPTSLLLPAKYANS
jgi:hypothetical protein